MSEFSPHPDFDQESEAFLAAASLEQTRKDAESEMRSHVALWFDDVLAEHGYTPLEEDPVRYDDEHGAVVRDLLSDVAARHGTLPDGDEFTEYIGNWAGVRVLELDNLEKFVIRSTVENMTNIAMVKEYGSAGDLATVTANVEDWKRGVFASLLVRRRMKADNPAIRAMVAFLPGGPIHEDDEAMLPYFLSAVEGLPEAEAKNERTAEFSRRLYRAVGIDADSVTYELRIDERELQIGRLVQEGHLLYNLSHADREARLYEFAAQTCTLFTRQNVHDLVTMINDEVELEQKS